MSEEKIEYLCSKSTAKVRIYDYKTRYTLSIDFFRYLNYMRDDLRIFSSVTKPRQHLL